MRGLIILFFLLFVFGEKSEETMTFSTFFTLSQNTNTESGDGQYAERWTQKG